MSEKLIFASRLSQLRKSLGITQTELAEKIGYSRANISHWERGNREPDLRAIVVLADFFGVSTDYLLGRQLTLW